LNKIRQYFTTLEITRGLFIALLGSAFIYLSYWDFSTPLLNTILGLLTLYFLLRSETKTWFFTGAFLGFFWFWWISLSLIHYDMIWAAPIVILIIMGTYGLMFAFIAWISEKVTSIFTIQHSLLSLTIKAFGLLLLSYIHPFTFDWFKPELLFVESYIGIEKWQFSIVLLAIILSIWRQQFIYLFLILFAYQIDTNSPAKSHNDIALINTHTTVEEKWNQTKHDAQFEVLLNTIDKAITEKKSLIVLPESVFPIFLNRSEKLLNILQKKAQNINIVTGALYWDGTTPRNSTYIFTKNNMTIANKVLLVPFGEANPLPDFLSDWVNRTFYDNAVDYRADSNVIDYTIDGITYRNAICFEATSEKLYEKDKNGNYPQHMIVLSNNGWFVPSIEPTLQKLLLQYYSKKYGTTMYHAINMSDSYIIQNGLVTKE